MGTIGSTKSPPGWFKGPSDAPKSSTPPTRICHLAKSGTIWVKMLPMRRHGELLSEMVLWHAPNGGSGALGCSTQPRPCTHLSPGPKTTSAREGAGGGTKRGRTICPGPQITALVEIYDLRRIAAGSAAFGPASRALPRGRGFWSRGQVCAGSGLR